MRVFDVFKYNIADRVAFNKTQPYLAKMLSEIGLSYEKLAFGVRLVGIDEEKIAEQPYMAKFPSLLKYSHTDYICAMLTSFPAELADGVSHFADKADEKDILTFFTKIPHTVNPFEAQLIYSGIKWHDGCDTSPAADLRMDKAEDRFTNADHFCGNQILSYRDFDDGRKFNKIEVMVEAGADGQRDNSEITAKLAPYLGEPEGEWKRIIFDKEEALRYAEKQRYWERELTALAMTYLQKHFDVVKDRSIRRVPVRADKKALNKAFKDTGFTPRKGSPFCNAVSCTDSHGYWYYADAARNPSGWQENFYVSFEIRGYNFKIYCIPGYALGTAVEGGENEILSALAEFAVRVRDEYADKMAQDFGDTPEWYLK